MSVSNPFDHPHSISDHQPIWAIDLRGMFVGLMARLKGDAQQEAQGKGFVVDPARKDYLADIGMEVDF
ncbi:MAG: hypothetical protein WBC68_14510 [Albidovulum sp.]